jgi:hypothetical protein
VREKTINQPKKRESIMKLKSKKEILTDKVNQANARIVELTNELATGQRDQEDFIHELTKASSILKTRSTELTNHLDFLATL